MSKAKTLATTVSTGGVLDNPSAIPAANISGAVGSATNLAGGSNGTIPYQSASGTTQMLAVGTAGYVLQTNGVGAPTWVALAAGSSAGGVIWENSLIISANYTLSTAKNGFSVGPITINSGYAVTVPSGQRWVVI